VRANCPAGTGSYVQAQFTTDGVPVACPGPYDVSTNGTTGGAAGIPLNTDIKGLVEVRGDVDHYQFTYYNRRNNNFIINNIACRLSTCFIEQRWYDIAIIYQ
jgi:hypothetical protein